MTRLLPLLLLSLWLWDAWIHDAAMPCHVPGAAEVTGYQLRRATISTSGRLDGPWYIEAETTTLQAVDAVVAPSEGTVVVLDAVAVPSAPPAVPFCALWLRYNAEMPPSARLP